MGALAFPDAKAVACRNLELTNCYVTNTYLTRERFRQFYTSYSQARFGREIAKNPWKNVKENPIQGIGLFQFA